MEQTQWPDPWSPVDDPEERSAFEAELQVETRKGHPLYATPVSAIGRRYDQDTVLFQLRDGTKRVAEVTLTWSGKKEKPPTPATTAYESFTAWAAK